MMDKDGERLLPSTPLALYARILGLYIGIDDSGRPKIGGEVIAADDESKIRINCAGPPGSFGVLSFREALESARKKEALPRRDGAVVLIGITAGVHTAKVVVGAIGSPGRLDCTAIGDTVNAASRVESENKPQSTEVLLSAATVSLLSPEERATLWSRRRRVR